MAHYSAMSLVLYGPDNVADMWPHFVKLLLRSWNGFLAGQGTTGLGLFTPVIIFVCSVALTFFVIYLWRGRRELVEHWKGNTAIAILCAVVVNALVYSVLFCRSVVNTAYDDHESLVQANRELKSDVNSLQNTPPKTVRSKVMRVEDIADLMDLVQRLEGTMNDIRPVQYVISAAPGSLESERFANVTAALLKDACWRVGGPVQGPRDNCQVGIAKPYTAGKDEDRLRRAAPDSGVVIHSESEIPAAITYRELSKLFANATWKQDMPKEMNSSFPHQGFKTFIWIEFGKHVSLREYVCGGPNQSGTPCVRMLGAE